MGTCKKLAHLLVFRKSCLIDTIFELEILKCRNNKSTGSSLQFVHRRLALPYAPAEIRANGEVHIKHHDEIGPRKKACNVAPGVELAIKRINDEMHINVC